MTNPAHLFRPVQLTGNISWASANFARASSFCRLISGMDWGAAWHAYSCALANDEMIQDFDPILPDLIAGLGLRKEGRSDSSTSWVWDELAEESCFLRVCGTASELACVKFIEALSQNLMARNVFSSLMTGSSPVPPNLRAVVAQAFGNISQADFEKATTLNAVPIAGLESEWVKIMAIGRAPHAKEIARLVFKNKWIGASSFLQREAIRPGPSEFFEMLKSAPEIIPIALEMINPDVLRKCGIARVLGEPLGGGHWAQGEIEEADGNQAAFIKTLWDMSIVDSIGLSSYMERRDFSRYPKTMAVTESLVLSQSIAAQETGARAKPRI